MKLSKKKTCNDCKALSGDLCILNFDIKCTKKTINAIIFQYVPNEPCYKPKTNKELVLAINLEK
ncbi:MAG: hypothetical protein WC679_01840 [Bacteroidales bacterium]|jgi:hypothetical protein